MSKLNSKLKKCLSQRTILLIGIGSHGQYSGISKNFEMLIGGMKERKIPFLIVTIKSRSEGSIGSFDMLHGLWVISSIFESWAKLFFVRNIYLQIAFSKFGFFRDFLILWPASILRKKIFIRVHTGGYGIFYYRQSRLIQWLIRITLSRVKKIIVLGESLRSQFEFSGKLLEKTVVVPNGVEKQGNKSNNSPREYKRGEIFRILFLSNLIESKGYLDVLKACHLLYQGGVVDFRCDFCGAFLAIQDEENPQSPTERKTYFLKLIDEWKLTDHVYYHGSVTGIKKQGSLENAHVLILPTAYLWEGQPLSILEALSVGVPVISTVFRAIPEQIEDGYNGLLVDYGSPDQIKEAILRMKENESFYQLLSQNALIRYNAKFTKQMHFDLLIPLITQ